MSAHTRQSRRSTVGSSRPASQTRACARGLAHGAERTVRACTAWSSAHVRACGQVSWGRARPSGLGQGAAKCCGAERGQVSWGRARPSGSGQGAAKWIGAGRLALPSPPWRDGTGQGAPAQGTGQVRLAPRRAARSESRARLTSRALSRSSPHRCDRVTSVTSTARGATARAAAAAAAAARHRSR